MRTGVSRGLAASALALALAMSLVAAAEALSAGTTAPEIAVVDQTGRPRDLASLTPGKGVVLLFTRSLSW